MATNTPYLQYTPAVERPADDEAETGRALVESMRSISEKTLADGGHALRSVHAKSHGFLQGRLNVAAGLPPELAQGLFSKPGSYPVVMRFSTIPGDILDDSVSTPRGVAIKVIGVEGDRLEGSEAGPSGTGGESPSRANSRRYPISPYSLRTPSLQRSATCPSSTRKTGRSFTTRIGGPAARSC